MPPFPLLRSLWLTSDIRNLSNFHKLPYLRKYSRAIYGTKQRVYTRILDAYAAIVLNDVSMLNDFSRSQTVMYAVKVLMSRKRCKIETLVLQTTIEWYRFR